MESSAGLWSALTIVAALLLALGAVLIAARVLAAARLRRERDALAKTASPQRIDTPAERSADQGLPRT